MIQLNPPIPMTHIEKGNGYAIALIDLSQEHDLLWVIAIDGTGEIWTAMNRHVRMQKNITLGRKLEGKESKKKGRTKEYDELALLLDNNLGI